MESEKGIFKQFITRTYSKIKDNWHTDRNMYLFAFEGIVITLVNNIINNNNNLFASRADNYFNENFRWLYT